MMRISFPMNAFSSFFAVLMLFSGLTITVRLRGFQFRRLGEAFRAVFLPGKRRKPGQASAVTPFQAMASALGASVGTANIAGVAGALAIGGPGAVFWMWVAALLGMAVKFTEIVLAILFREKRTEGWLGGPMLYIEKGLGKLLPCRLPALLAHAFALFTIAASLISTPIVQANTVYECLVTTAGSVLPAAKRAVSVCAAPLCALFSAIVMLGGAKRIGRLSALLVPFMAAAYIAACAAVLIRFRSNIPSALLSIFRGAFSPGPAAGGIGVYGMLRAFRVGTARGVYSNEAGVGSSPMAHAAADTDDPVRQGFFGIFEVFMDTIVMCTLTALTVLSSGVQLSENGAAAALAAFSKVFGPAAAGTFLSSALALFAFTSMIGWSNYGLTAAEFLFGSRSRLPFILLFAALTAVSGNIRAGAAWRLGETLNYLMALPNMIAVLLLSPAAAREARAFELTGAKRKARSVSLRA